MKPFSSKALLGGNKNVASVSAAASRSVTTLSETLMAQVPDKQKKLVELKKNHGKQV